MNFLTHRPIWLLFFKFF